MSADLSGAARVEAILLNPQAASWEDFLGAIEQTDFLLPFDEQGNLAMVGTKELAWVIAFTSEQRVKEGVAGDPVIFMMRQRRFLPSKLLPWLPGPPVPGQLLVQISINPGTKPCIILNPEVIAQLRERAALRALPQR